MRKMGKGLERKWDILLPGAWREQSGAFSQVEGGRSGEETA